MSSTRTAVTYDGVKYEPGTRFRVISEGGRLVGMRAVAPFSWQGWRQNLAVGDIIMCNGFGPGFGMDPGYGVEFTSEKSLAEHVVHVMFEPNAGTMWDGHPRAGFLEPLQVVSAS